MTAQTRREYLTHALTATGLSQVTLPVASLNFGWAATERWQRSFETAYNQEAYGLVSTQDGEFVVASYAGGSRTSYRSELWLVKFQANGDITWKRRIGEVDGVRTPRATTITEAGDGSLIVGNRGNLVIKTKPNGEPQWIQGWATEFEDVFAVYGPLQVAGTPEGGCVIAAALTPEDAEPERSMVIVAIRFAPDGTLEWRRSTAFEAEDLTMDAVFVDPDGTYVASNPDDSFRVDDFSSPNVQKIFSVDLTENPQDTDLVSSVYTNAIRTPDGDFITRNQGPGATRFDPNGNVIWDTDLVVIQENDRYGEDGLGLCLTDEGHVATVGYAERQATRPGWIVVMDAADGTVLKTHRFSDLEGGDVYRKAQHVVPSPKGFMVAGYRSPDEGLDTRLWVGDVAVREDYVPDLPHVLGGLSIGGAAYWAYKRRTNVNEATDE